ncbi:hypothetical protein BH24ACT6_BH24ACT6_09150 [soil metagenome]
MITAIHTLIYSEDPQATRDFFRDVLQWAHVEASGPEPGWLIFKTGPSELGVHPTMPGTSHATDIHHEVSFLCDDLESTMEELSSRGASFSGEVSDEGFGLVAMLELPGAGEILLYEPRHETAFDL